MKRLRSDLNETTTDTANYEGIFSGMEPVGAAAAGPTAGATAAKDVVGSPPAGAPENLKGGSTDSTAGRLGGLSMLEEVAPAAATAASSSPKSSRGGGDGAADALSTRPPPAKRHKPTRATAATATAEAGAVSVAAGGEKELREQLAKQNRLLADMARELEAFRKERSAGGSVAMNVRDVDGTAGEGSAILPVSWRWDEIGKQKKT